MDCVTYGERPAGAVRGRRVHGNIEHFCIVDLMICAHAVLLCP